ncbi:trypsin-like peptidase domain-containing protein [Streptomyces sp. NPDC004609]|uniref:trypsin-like peptidase domain-containing protein n=1 Tax=Streptomyces sp. NPDC004609 TaxID=3364704 RepID=UPI0036BCDBFD
MTGSGKTGDETLERLRILTERHVVGIHAAGVFCGTGFLAAPDTVLTCAHVVAGRRDLTAAVEGVPVTAEVVRMAPPTRGAGGIHGYPDLAELRLSEPVDGAAGVWLDRAAPLQSASVSVHGFSGHTLEPGVQPDTLRLQVAGRSGRYVRLQGDQVVQGFSGGPVLNTATGRVCGILKASRSEKGTLGGWLIPVEALEECSPGLLERNHRAHGPGTVWFDTAGDRARRQSELFGPDPAGGTAAHTTPARMLSLGAMPFVERPELGELHRWCREAPGQLLRLLYAPGGSGKTRLSAELGRELRNDGWIAGFAARDTFKDPLDRARWLETLTDTLATGFPVLVVFDYAQARLGDISALLAHVHRNRPPAAYTLRVLLLARSEEPLWSALREELEERHIEDTALRGASVRGLPGRIPGKEPGALATEAFDAFSRLLDCAGVSRPASLARRAREQDSLLGVLATALDAVLTLRQGDTWDESDDPLDRICSHEIRGWHALLEDRLGGGPFAGRAGRGLAQGILLVPTLAQRRGRRPLTRLLARVREAAFPGQPALNTPALYACFRELYPSDGDRVAPLEPDRIGEILVRRVFRQPESSGDEVAYLRAVLDTGDLRADRTESGSGDRTGSGAATGAGSDERTAAVLDTLDVLARARGCTAVGRVAEHPAHRILDEALEDVLRENPELLPALTATGARVPHAEPLAELMRPLLADCDTGLLHRIEDELPGYPSSLSSVSALVLARLLALPDDTVTEDNRLVRLRRLLRHSLRLEECGRGPEALSAADEAVLLSRDLVRYAERHRPHYAAALHNLSLLRHRAGETEAALELAVEAVSLYRQVTDGHPMETAGALSTLALLRLIDGQVNGAAADAAEGVMRCAQVPPGERQEDVLLTCLEVLAECRHRTGLPDEALTSGAEAVELLRELAERRPGRYLARLPDTLQRHGVGLIRAGRLTEAYLTLREAVHRRAALPLSTSPRLRDQQATALSVLTQLSAELDGFAHERSSWLEMQAATDGLCR